MSPNPAVLTWPRPPFAVAYLGSTVDESDRPGIGSYTFSAQPFGAASAARHIVVMGAVRHSSDSGSFTGVTIGGNSATVTTLLASGQTRTFYAVASVPTGTSGDVVVSVNAVNTLRCAIALWRVSVAPATVATGTAPRNADNPVSLTIASHPGGHVIATLAVIDTDVGAVAWTGLTERFDRQIGAEAMWWSGGDGPTTGAPVTVTADWSVNGATSEDLSAVTIRLA